MSLLTDRASLLREFFRLVNADASDDDMIEHDDSTLEGAYEALDVGLKQAQLYLISIGRGDRWLTTSSTLTFSGSDPNKKAALPADFLRLDSDPDQRRSGLKYPTGKGWGMEIDIDDRNSVSGNYYYLREESDGLYYVYVARGGAPPSNLTADYYTVIDALADSTDADMRIDDRPIIAVYAADYAKSQAWFPGGPEQRAEITNAVAKLERGSYRRNRLTRRNRKTQQRPTTGRWFI